MLEKEDEEITSTNGGNRLAHGGEALGLCK